MLTGPLIGDFAILVDDEHGPVAGGVAFDARKVFELYAVGTSRLEVQVEIIVWFAMNSHCSGPHPDAVQKLSETPWPP